jgi:putative transposase
MDIFSRKNLNSGVYLRSFSQKEVKVLWDETLFKENINTAELTILSDNGGPMKGRQTREHLSRQWQVTLVHSRPHTPDDNPWIEAFIKGLKYHPVCPESFETMQEVINWVNLYQEYYNNHPHSALGYVRPNEEHTGLGKAIRQQRKDNLKLARKERLAYYYECKARVREQESGQRLEVVHNSFALC